jgi:ribose transport system permease protein
MHDIETRGIIMGKLNIEKVKQFIPFLGLIVVVIFFQITSGGRLIKAANLSIFTNHAFSIIVASCGAVFLMSQGNLDFSMAGNVCITAAITALTSRISIPLAVITALLCGSILGVINSLTHIVLGVPAFIATLATSFMYTGLANVILGSGSLAANYSMKKMDNLILKLTVLSIILALTFLVLEFTPFGKQCKAIGSKMEVARQSGVNITTRKIVPFIISGFACGVIAVFSILRTCTASTTTGASTQINTILALLLGGIPFSGGWASRFRGVIVGSLLMAVVVNGLVVIDIPVMTQLVIKGILFVIAVAISFDRKNATVIK